MTAISVPASAPAPRFLAACWAAALDTYRCGGRAMWLATPIVALVVVPEFVQHLAEIHLGMFESIAQFRTHAADPLRMGFGYAKVAGVVLVMLLTARFWAFGGSVRRAFAMRPLVIGKLVLALVVTALLSEAGRRIGVQLSSPIATILVTIVAVIVQALATVAVVAMLLEDPAFSLRRLFTRGWRAAIAITALLVIAYGPAFALHMATHKLAMGLPVAAVFAIMTIDALVVGLLATLAGSALAVGYAAGTGTTAPAAR